MLSVVARDEFTLPTIYTAYKAVQDYLDALEQFGLKPDSPALIRPVDSLAFHLLLDMLPSQASVIDLAAQDSFGATTVLSCCQSKARQVTFVCPPVHSANAPWRAIMRDCLDGMPPSVMGSHHEVTDQATLSPDAFTTPTTLVLLSLAGKPTAEVTSQIAQMLERGNHVAVLLLGIQDVGEWEALPTMAASYNSASPFRFVLLREQAAALHDCRLGLIFHRSHPSLQDALPRLRHFFTGNFSFLSLTQRACAAAMAAAQEESSDYVSPLAHARKQLADREYELAAIRNSITFRAMCRFKDLFRPLGSGRSIRRRLYHKAVRTLQVLRTNGFSGLKAKIAKRFLQRFQTPTATK